MMKKAQSISINTIIVAAIALLVLVVMIAIFSGRIKVFSKESRSCANQGGAGCFQTCNPDDGTGPLDPGVYTPIPGTDCDDREGNLKCCKLIVPFSEEET